jgi:hypothetical protein
MKPEGRISWSEEPANGPYSEPDELRQHPDTLLL